MKSNISDLLPSTLTILPTYQCSAACRNCCFGSNPSIKHRLSLEEMIDYIEQAADIPSIRMICFSGGEVFLLGDDLVELIKKCSDHGLMTRIVTNGYWALSNELATKKLSPLIAAGLNELNFSTGDEHVQWVPLKRVLQGMSSALNTGITLALMVENTAERSITAQVVIRESKKFPKLYKSLLNNEIQMIESPWMPFKDSSLKYKSSQLVNSSNIHHRGPCTSILRTAVIPPSKKLGMCCGLPREEISALSVGSLEEHSLKSLLEKSMHDFLKIWLFVEGPEKILAWAASKDEKIIWENQYAHNCDACRRVFSDDLVMKSISSFYQEKFDDVLFKYSLYLEGKNECKVK